MSNWENKHEYFNTNSKLSEVEKTLIKASLRDEFIRKWYLDREEKVKEKTKLEQWRDKFRTKDSEYECDNIQTREVLFEKHNPIINNVIRQKIALNQQRIKARNFMKGYVNQISEPTAPLSGAQCFKPTAYVDIDNLKPECENPMVEFIDLCDFFS